MAGACSKGGRREPLGQEGVGREIRIQGLGFFGFLGFWGFRVWDLFGVLGV